MVLIKRRGMKMISEICKLNEAELEVVAGGMTCDAASGAAEVYATTSKILGIMGDTTGSDIFLGMAIGVRQGIADREIPLT
jgi:hypothetical protein